jgi:hypothetical protein
MSEVVVNVPGQKQILIGEITQLAGIGSVIAGLVLSLHHWPAALALIAGGAAYYIGKKLRGV